MRTTAGHTSVVTRWNPCQSIRYKLNLRHAPKGALADVRTALARTSAATGLTYVYAGTTTTIPSRASIAKVDPAHPLLVIAWAAPGRGTGHSELLPSSAAGVGGSVSVWWTSRDGVAHPPRIVGGYLVVNSRLNARLPGGFSTRTSGTRGGLLLHELGHTVGLDHTDDPSQLMYPTLVRYGTWGAGDLAGLRRVGRAAGCLR